MVKVKNDIAADHRLISRKDPFKGSQLPKVQKYIPDLALP